MRRSVTCIVLIALLYCQCAPRYYSGYSKITLPIIISEVVGDVVDADERNHYGLFKGIDDFEEARFYAIEEGGLYAEIQTTNNTLAVVLRERQMRLILKDYIDNYEFIQSAKRTFEKEWKIVDYDTLGFPITRNEVVAVRSQGCCIAGATGFGLVSLGLSALSGWGYAMNHDASFGAWVMMMVGGTTAGLIAGGLLGGIIDRDRAIDVIREARKPRQVSKKSLD